MFWHFWSFSPTIHPPKIKISRTYPPSRHVELGSKMGWIVCASCAPSAPGFSQIFGILNFFSIIISHTLSNFSSLISPPFFPISPFSLDLSNFWKPSHRFSSALCLILPLPLYLSLSSSPKFVQASTSFFLSLSLTPSNFWSPTFLLLTTCFLLNFHLSPLYLSSSCFRTQKNSELSPLCICCETQRNSKFSSPGLGKSQSLG